MALVFKLSKAGKSTDGVQPLVTLGDGWAMSSPGDRRFRAHMVLVSLGGKSGEAGQKITAVRQGKARGSAQRQIPFHSGDHGSTPGQGWAICFSRCTSALA